MNALSRQRYLFFVSFLLLANDLFAQNTPLSKNGYLQKRFYENFIFSSKDISAYNLGRGSTNSNIFTNLNNWGLNIPINKIRFKNCHDGNNDNKNCWIGNAEMGDATSMLGFYIAYLATEYEIRKRAQQSTKLVLLELYKAMKTYERLDILAEYHIYGIQDHQLNGFFLRDDYLISRTDYLKSTGANYYPFKHDIANPLWFNSDMRKQDDPRIITNGGLLYNYRTAGNGKIEEPPNPKDWPFEIENMPSQDQVTYLMMAFALVKKFLPNSMTLIDEATNTRFNFHESANFYVNTIISYAKSKGYIFELPFYYLNQQPFKISKYADARFNSWGLAKAASRITGRAFQDFNSPIAYFNYASWLASRCSNYSWYQSNQFNRSMNLTLAAVGDSWDWVYYKCKPKWYEVILYALTPFMIPATNYQMAICAGTGSCTKQTLSKIDENANRWAMPLTPILFRVLHDRTDWMPVRIYEMTNKMLRTMPCEGPAYAEVTGFDANNNPIYRFAAKPWTTDNFHVYKYKVNGSENNPNDPNTYGWQGAFNGLDYLLLFNLYALLPEYTTKARASNPALYPFGGLHQELIPHPGVYTPYYYNPTIENLVVDNNVPKFGSGKAEFSGSYVLTVKNTDVYHRNAQTVFLGETEVVLGNGTRIFRGADVVIRIGKPYCYGSPEQWGYKDDDLDEEEQEYITDSALVNRPEVELQPEVLPTEPQFNLYPNPVVGSQSGFQLQVFFPETQVEEGVALEIFSMEGRVVLKKQLPLTSIGFHQFRFTAQELGLSKGIYAVQVQHGTTKLTKRLIVQ